MNKPEIPTYIGYEEKQSYTLYIVLFFLLVGYVAYKKYYDN
jgi:hypothetical protein